MTIQRNDRVLITGGSGFLGSHVVEALLHRGVQVTSVDNNVTGPSANLAHLLADDNLTVVTADVSDPDPARALPAQGRFDAVMHLASPCSPPDFDRIPVEILQVGSMGTQNCLQRAKTDGARFLLASTSEVYGDPLVHPQPETYYGNVNSIGARSMYDESKRYAEALTMAYHRAHGVDVAIVRIFNTYGPRMRADDGRAIPNFINQALRGEEITLYGQGTQTRSICYVSDQVTAMLAMLDSGEVGPINCGTEHELSMVELAELIRRLSESDSELVYRPLPENDPLQRRPDISRARELLGFEPQVAPEQGLRATIDYFRGLADAGLADAGAGTAGAGAGTASTGAGGSSQSSSHGR